MKSLSVKYLISKIDLRSSLMVSFALHIALVALAPAMALNRTTPLKEEAHNKVRITMLKNEVHKPGLKTASFKPQSMNRPAKIQKVSRVLPEVSKVAKPVPHRQHLALTPAQPIQVAERRVPEKMDLSASSSRTPLKTQSSRMQVAQVAPRPTQAVQSHAIDSFRSKRVEPETINTARAVTRKTVVPIKKVNHDIRNSGPQAPAAKINPKGETVMRRPNVSLSAMVPVSSGTVGPKSRSKLISMRSQGSSAVSVASLRPIKMASVSFEEPSRDTEIAPDLLERIMNEFYAKVGRKISLVKIYPDFARKSGYEGKTLIAFRIDRNGKILGLSVSRSSGHEILDEAALQAVKDAGPYPPIPDELNKSSLNFQIPISYALR